MGVVCLQKYKVAVSLIPIEIIIFDKNLAIKQMFTLAPLKN